MKGQERSTATVQRVDVSPTYHGASAAPANPEDLLFRAYGSVVPGKSGLFRVTNQRMEPCVCGGTIVLSGGEAVDKIVNEHNDTARHRAWRAWRELA